MSEPTNKTKNTSFKYGSSSSNQSGNPATVNGGRVLLVDSFQGSKNPSYKDQIRQVVSATTAASGVKHKVEYKSAHGRYDWETQEDPKSPFNQKGYTIVNWWIPSIVTGTPSTNQAAMASARNQAIAKLYDRISSIESSAQTGEDLGEISQTLKLLRSPLQPLRNLITSTVSKHHRAINGYQGTVQSAQRTAKALGDTLLEYRFGIKPLVNTVADVAVGLQNRDYMAHYIPFFAEASTEHNSSLDSTFEGVDILTFQVSRVAKEKRTVRFNGVWGVQVGVNRRSVADVASLRLRDVVPTIWNLIPYSFLVDYFTNVGDIVNGLTLPWGGVRWCVETNKSVYSSSATIGSLVVQPTRYRPRNTVSSGYSRYSYEAFARTGVVSIPRPTLEFNVPSGRQWQNIAALIIGRIPIIGSKLASLSKRSSNNLQSAFADEVGRRGLRTPYPFH